MDCAFTYLHGTPLLPRECVVGPPLLRSSSHRPLRIAIAPHSPPPFLRRSSTLLLSTSPVLGQLPPLPIPSPCPSGTRPITPVSPSSTHSSSDHNNSTIHTTASPATNITPHNANRPRSTTISTPPVPHASTVSRHHAPSHQHHHINNSNLPHPVVCERTALFSAEGRFYRPTSAVVRDLGVLAATVLSNALLLRPIRVLDVCSGTGVRALRYLGESPTNFVWANDAQTQASSVLLDNLASHVATGHAHVTVHALHDLFQLVRLDNSSNINHNTHLSNNTAQLYPHSPPHLPSSAAGTGPPTTSTTPPSITHAANNSSPPAHPHHHTQFDLVDLDMFGACGLTEVQAALDVLNPSGGLLYLSSTDSVSAAGKNPTIAQHAWHAHVHSHPAVNEQFLRLIIGTAAQAAASKHLEVKPVFSYFHPLSSTARVMIRVKPEKLPDMAQKRRRSPEELAGVGYLTHCMNCGQNSSFSIQDTIDPALASCSVCSASQKDQNPFLVNGPLWIGRLHNEYFCREMRSIAYARHSNTEDWRSTQKVLSALIAEASLPPLYYTIADIGKRIGTSPPPRRRIFDELARLGFASSPSHCRPKCLKTDAPLEVLLAAARTAAADVKAMSEVVDGRVTPSSE